MSHLCGTLQKIETCGKATFGCRQTLCQIVQESYDLCTSAGTSTLEETIKNHGYEGDVVLSNKYIRQVDKIGRYWRLCKSMTENSRKYAEAFTDVQLEVLRPYQGKTSSIAFEDGQRARCLVHAEMQIIAFYSTASNATLKKPRIIGVSKSACYLCNLFIHRHNRFFTTQTHGRLYERWNFPDLEDFDPRERVDLCRILAEIDQELQIAFVKAGEIPKKRNYPMGSWLTLPAAHQLSPIPSTVCSVVSKDCVESDERCTGPSMAHEPDELSPAIFQPLPPSFLAHTSPPVHANGLMYQSNSTTAHGPIQPPQETPLSSGCTESWELPAQKEFTAIAPIRMNIGGMSLIFETEGAARGSVVVARILDSGNPIPASSIDLDALEPNEVSEFAREADSENMVLNLNHSQGRSIQITLRWL